MNHILPKSMIFVFGILIMLASCEYDYFVVPAPVPRVSSSSPGNGDTGVSLNKTITVTFDQEMGATSFNRNSFTLFTGTSEVSGVVSCDGSIASFTPSSMLIPNTNYTGTITTGAKNTFGVSITSNYVWTFKTGADTTSNDTTIVVTDTISFSQDIIPFFASNCVACHKGSTPPDLRSNMAYNSLINGGYVVANDIDNSSLYQSLKPGGSMKAYASSSQLALVKRWILAGAKND